MAAKLLLLFLSAYRRLASPFLPPTCRFHPSCSAYMQEAIRRYGIVNGIISGLCRLGRCHPWHPGGYDPVK